MKNYESGKERVMEAFGELINEAGVYSYDEATLKVEMRRLLQYLDACRAYSHPGMK